MKKQLKTVFVGFAFCQSFAVISFYFILLDIKLNTNTTELPNSKLQGKSVKCYGTTVSNEFGKINFIL